ncbi:PREDICTED: ammonium transporter Rh type B [Tinamus guttatus]|uniref:ammonium transporter Rh type B n=1 Tax=Tinamus guttatus TaxID=94827 RepID=UPI00052EBE3D|nr:PREDICTED: ammonium transporter Rh type B [Tinamus guttatus]
MSVHAASSRLKVSGLCFLLQMLLIILFAVFVRYSPDASPGLRSPQLNCSSRRNPGSGSYYPRSRNVCLQTLMGFGFLMVFLGRYSMGSVAACLLVTTFAIQWALFIQGFIYSFQNGKIYMEAQSMVGADFCAGAVLVSVGAVLGWGNPLQMLLLPLLEVPVFSANEYILLHVLGVRDSGGSLTVHTFGAYFGLTLSRFLRQHRADKREQQQQDTGVEPWAELNTYMAMAASTLATFVMSPLLREDGTPWMSQVQDATMAGAVMMGMAGEMLLAPFGALIAGFLAGLIPPLSSRFLAPVLLRKLGIRDARSVHGVHGVPGTLGTLLGTLLAALATADTYGDRLQLAFPSVADGSRTATYQALCQLCALPITLIFAVFGGSVTGVILKIKCLGSLDTPYLEKETLRELVAKGCASTGRGDRPDCSGGTRRLGKQDVELEVASQPRAVPRFPHTPLSEA